jgi:hypothetical protein
MTGTVPVTVLQDGSVEIFWGESSIVGTALVEGGDEATRNPVTVPAVRALIFTLDSFLQKELKVSHGPLVVISRAIIILATVETGVVGITRIDVVFNHTVGLGSGVVGAFLLFLGDGGRRAAARTEDRTRQTQAFLRIMPPVGTIDETIALKPGELGHRRIGQVDRGQRGEVRGEARGVRRTIAVLLVELVFQSGRTRTGNRGPRRARDRGDFKLLLGEKPIVVDGQDLEAVGVSDGGVVRAGEV